MRKPFLHIAIICFLSIGFTACDMLDGLFSRDDSNLRNGSESSEFAEVLSDENGAVTAKVSSSSSSYQVVSASSTSKIQGSEIRFPPGALAIDTQILIEEGASLESEVNDGELIGERQASTASNAVVVRAVDIDETTQSFSISIPLLEDEARLTLSDSYSLLIVAYKVYDKATKKFAKGIISRDSLSVSRGKVQFQSKRFGAFQAFFLDIPLSSTTEVETEEAPQTKQEELQTSVEPEEDVVEEEVEEPVANTPQVPLTPTTINAEAKSDSQIFVSWQDVAEEQGYKLERADFSTSCGAFTEIASLDVDVVNYTDSGLASNGTYCYQVKSYNAFGNSEASSSVMVATLLSAPSSLTVTAGVTVANLSWAASTGAESYAIFWSTSPSVTVDDNRIDHSSMTSYTHTSISGGTDYYYRVAGVKSGIVGMLSGEATARPLFGTVASPVFSVTSGAYTTTQTISITSSTTGASIRYTTDGSDPTSELGTLYSGSFKVGEGTTTIKTIAYLTDWLDSSVSSETYTVNLSGTAWVEAQRFPTVDTILDFFFLDASLGWFVGDGGAIYKTTDGGTNWTYIGNSQIRSMLHEVEFLDASNGWIAGDKKTLLKTTDGGATWTEINTGAAASASFKALDFIDANTGWVSGSTSGIVYRTTNGGTTWTEHDTLNGNEIQDLVAIDASKILAFGANGRATISNDGGSSWGTETAGSNSLNSAFFIDSNQGWAVGNAGTIMSTTDGGTSWISRSSGTPNSLYKIHFVDSNNGWAVGNSNTVLKTTDGGVTWAAAGSTGTAYAIHSFGGGKVIVGGQFSTLFTTENNGLAWNDVGTGITSSLYSISFASKTKGFAVGHGGKLLKTSDGGDSWVDDSANLNSLKSLRHILFIDENNGWIVASNGYIYYTSDGGNSWSQQVTGVTATLNKIHYRDSTLWVVGYSDTVLKSTDMGGSWQSLITGTSGETFFGVHFIDGNTGWILGTNATVLHTVDGGISFSSQTASGASTLQDVHFFDANNGIGVGIFGKVIRTSDGGTNWTVSSLSTSYTLYSLTMLSPDIGWAVGANGALMKTVDAGATWTLYHSGAGVTYNQVYFRSPLDGWIVGAGGSIRRLP